MRIVSLNVGRPALTVHNGRQYSTAINRRPMQGLVLLTAQGFTDDRVADDENHGGPDRAACCYACEHYPYWSRRLGVELPIPSFGENLTTGGLLERDVCIGDVYQVGGALVQVSQPRQPCWKLANKLNSRELPAWITAEAFTGFYIRVLEEGHVQAGDRAVLVNRPNPDVTVARTALAILTDAGDPSDISRLAELPELSQGWRTRAARRLSNG